MAGSAERPSVASQPIARIEDAWDIRRAPNAQSRAAGVQTGAAEHLLSAMRTVKAARFNSAERLERKHALSLFAMSMVSLYFVGLSVWQAVYAPLLNEAANRLITLVSIMSSIFTLVLALIEAMNDYRMKAHHMHECALAVNDLYYELKLTPSGDVATVQEFRHRYNATVRNCAYNHSHIDYLMAKVERGAPWADRVWAQLRYALDVYGLYGLALIVPPLVLVLCA